MDRATERRATELCPSVAPSFRRSSLRRSFAPSVFAPSLFRFIHSSLHNYSIYFIFSILIYRLIALSLFAPSFFAPSLCPSVAPSVFCSVAQSFAPSLCSVSLSLCHSSLRRSFAPSIAPYTINIFLISFLYFNIQTYPQTGTYEGGRTAPRRSAVLITTRPLRDHFFPCTITVMDSEKWLGDQNMDFLFGLGMIKRHGCKIYLERSALVFGLPDGQSMEALFLHEKDLDENKGGTRAGVLPM